MAAIDYYNTGDDNNGGNSVTTAWKAQSFTASQSYDVYSVKLKLYRAAGVTGTTTVHLRAASGDNPTGADLATGTIDTSTLTTDSNGDWYEFTLDTPISLTNGNQYALCLSDDSSGTVSWRGDFTSPSYGGGSSRTSNNSGSTWSAYGTGDFMFETYGPSATPIDASVTLTWGPITLSAAASVANVLAGSVTLGWSVAMSADVTLSANWQTPSFATTKRLVAVGNNQFWYEDL